MPTNNKEAKRKAHFYFYAGLDHEKQELLDAVKAKMAQKLGEEPSNLRLMVELMHRYIDHKQ